MRHKADAVQRASSSWYRSFLLLRRYTIDLLVGINASPHRLLEQSVGLRLDIKACSTATATLRSRIADDFELTSNQFHCIVDLTSFKQP